MKLWFSINSIKDGYDGTENEFVNLQEEDWAQDLLTHYDAIKKELDAFLSHEQMVPYFHQAMVNRKDTWKTLGFKFWNLEIKKYKNQFPTVYQWLHQHPSVVSCSFSQLEPKSKILPHSGDTNGIYRVHLGFQIPEGLPRCGFRVKKEHRNWSEKEFLGFVDAFEHEAWNDTEATRIIMLLDVIRPEFQHRKKLICNQVIAALVLQKAAAILKISNHEPNGKQRPMPVWLRRVMAKGMLCGVYIAMPAYQLYARYLQRQR